jgi:hypothetical protein
LPRLVALLSATTVVGCLAGPSVDSINDVTFTDHVQKMPLRDGASHDASIAPPAPVAPPGAHLTYRGGKVIQNVNITKVLYGSGTYIPELTATSGPNMVSSYTQMVTSGAFDWLSEYNTTSPIQTIGRGSVGASVQIAPASSRNGSTISDASIQAEIAAQIVANVLPAPSNNQIYMVHFPSGKTITQGGESSCVPSVASHELIEAVTVRRGAGASPGMARNPSGRGAVVVRDPALDAYRSPGNPPNHPGTNTLRPTERQSITRHGAVASPPLLEVSPGPGLAVGAPLLHAAVATPPVTTSANGWAELGTLNARTVTV